MIALATCTDAKEIARLAVKMWESHDIDELAGDFEKQIADDDAAVFICRIDGKTVGFAQCQLRRDYVEGTSSSPVGYLEGVFVEPAYRKHGYGKALVDACVQWAKEKECREFASDCEWNNEQSRLFHLQTGFQEANRIICFVKPI